MSKNKTTATTSGVLKQFLDKDPSLTKMMTYEQATATTSGINDSGIEMAYNAYLEVKNSGVEEKGLNDYIGENPSLAKMVTYEQATARTSGIDDASLEEVYGQYRKFKSRTHG